MRGEAGGSAIELRGPGKDLSFGSETEIEASLDNAGISVLSTEVGGVLRMLLPACIEKEELVDAVDGVPDCNKDWSMGTILGSVKAGCLEGLLIKEVPWGGTVDGK